MKHGERAHSKFSASGAERWIACPGSVALSEGLPDTSSAAANEGTRAHEILETLMQDAIDNRLDGITYGLYKKLQRTNRLEMVRHAADAANFILKKSAETPMSEVIVETRVYLSFIHPEMFGTFDGAVIDHFGTLHVFDFKYGKHHVSPIKNYQMIFYGMGLAAKYNWNFQKVRLWIVQPRAPHYRGPTFWEISTPELKAYVQYFAKAVKQVEETPFSYREGNWCFFCKAKGICPLKQEKRNQLANDVFK